MLGPRVPTDNNAFMKNSDESTFEISKSHATPTHFLNEIEKILRAQVFGKTPICAKKRANAINKCHSRFISKT